MSRLNRIIKENIYRFLNEAVYKSGNYGSTQNRERLLDTKGAYLDTNIRDGEINQKMYDKSMELDSHPTVTLKDMDDYIRLHLQNTPEEIEKMSQHQKKKEEKEKRDAQILKQREWSEKQEEENRKAREEKSNKKTERQLQKRQRIENMLSQDSRDTKVVSASKMAEILTDCKLTNNEIITLRRCILNGPLNRLDELTLDVALTKIQRQGYNFTTVINTIRNMCKR